MPRFTFEKFPGAEATLTTAMKSVGEAMSIGRTFQESLQKALRSMETGWTGMNEVEIEGAEIDGVPDQANILAALRKPVPDRILLVAQAFRYGLEVEEIYEACKIDRWFLRQIEQVVSIEEDVRANGLPETRLDMLRLKKAGFSDERLAELAGRTAGAVADHRRALDVIPSFKRIDTCAAEFPSMTPYMYSAYEGDGLVPGEIRDGDH